MKRKITKIRPDGSKEIVEEQDEAPARQKLEMQARQPSPQDSYLQRLQQGQRMMPQGQMPRQMPMQQAAMMGQRGDNQLAHVNNYEAELLKRLGGIGTRNPMTGLRQFYIDPTTGLENGLPAPTGNTTTPADMGGSF